jgi:kynurenine formamidase
MAAVEITPEELVASFREVSNWGRWGDDDELGTLNFITPDVVKNAASLVRSGRVVSIAHDLSTERSPLNVEPIRHRMIYRGAHPHTALDEVVLWNHGMFQTHLDAVTHCFFEGKTYNGRSSEEIVLGTGLSFGSIMAMKDGIVTRGVLLDIPRARGVDSLPPEEWITAADLDAAEEVAGLKVGTGDAVIIRSGSSTRERAEDNKNPRSRPGLGVDTPRWFHEREVALVAPDCPERQPILYPEVGPNWHTATLVFMGLMLLDTPDSDTLAQACAEEGTSEFMFTTAPLRIPGGTGCPVNPLAVF